MKLWPNIKSLRSWLLPQTWWHASLFLFSLSLTILVQELLPRYILTITSIHSNLLIQALLVDFFLTFVILVLTSVNYSFDLAKSIIMYPLLILFTFTALEINQLLAILLSFFIIQGIYNRRQKISKSFMIVNLHTGYSYPQIKSFLHNHPGATILSQTSQLHVSGDSFKNRQDFTYRCKKTHDKFILELVPQKPIHERRPTYLLKVAQVKVNKKRLRHPSREQVDVISHFGPTNSSSVEYFDQFKTIFFNNSLQEEKQDISIIEAAMKSPSTYLAIVDVTKHVMTRYNTYTFFLVSLVKRKPDIPIHHQFAEYDQLIDQVESVMPLKLNNLSHRVYSHLALQNPSTYRRGSLFNEILLDWQLFALCYVSEDISFQYEISNYDLEKLIDIIFPFTNCLPGVKRNEYRYGKMIGQDLRNQAVLINENPRNYLHIGKAETFVEVLKALGIFMQEYLVITDNKDFLDQFDNVSNPIKRIKLGEVHIPLLKILIENPWFCKKFLLVYLIHIKKDSRKYLAHSITMSIQKVKYENDDLHVQDLEISDLRNPDLFPVTEEDFYEVVKVIFEDILEHNLFQNSSNINGVISKQSPSNLLTLNDQIGSYVMDISELSRNEKVILVSTCLLLQEFGYFGKDTGQHSLIFSLNRESELENFFEGFLPQENEAHPSLARCFLQKNMLNDVTFPLLFDNISCDRELPAHVVRNVFDILPEYSRSGNILFKEQNYNSVLLQNFSSSDCTNVKTLIPTELGYKSQRSKFMTKKVMEVQNT